MVRSLQQQNLERLSIPAKVFGSDEVSRNCQSYMTANPARNAESWKREADRAAKEAELLRSLTPDQAIQRIEQIRQAEKAKQVT